MNRTGIILILLLAAIILIVFIPGLYKANKMTQEFTDHKAYEKEGMSGDSDFGNASKDSPANVAGHTENSVDPGIQTGLDIPVIKLSSDQDGDGMTDLEDIVEGARADANNKPRYNDAYYSGGYPPDDEGVCTDVLWRAFKNAGYLLKDMVDEDIKHHTELYPRVGGNPDPNIDFRRIQNLIVFFNRHAEVLTTDLIPGDTKNLVQWQGGDIVILTEPYEHTGILSDIRNEEGIPYLIHNGGPYTKEEDILPWFLSQGYEITWHFRFPKDPEQ